jgi:beta-N-acetylhexosaminidase
MSSKKTLHQAVGRLLSSRLTGSELDAKTRSLLQAGTIGGIVLFKENASSLRQLFDLVQSIKEASNGIPLLSVDQEGGAVQRFDHILSPLPSAMALAAINRGQLFDEIMALNARQLKMLGFNCLLAPVMDVLSNAFNPIISTRAFSNDPDKVTEFATQAINAIVKEGLVPVGKHFPGHGSTKEDSHTDLAVNNQESDAIWRLDLAPFRNCLEILPAIMVGHIWLKTVDNEPLPASISPRVIDGILRQYLKYDGVIMTDDMQMKAIVDKYSLEEASLRAIQAGCDHVLVCSTASDLEHVHEHIMKAVENGQLSEERVMQSVARLDRAFGVTKPEAKDKEVVFEELRQSVESSPAIVLEASTAAISQLRGKIPRIHSGEWLVITPNHSRYLMRLAAHLNARSEELRVEARLSKRNLRFAELRYSLEPSEEEAAQIGKDCAERNCIFLTFRTLLNQGQVKLGQKIRANSREHVHVACDIPFDLVGLPSWENSLATFDPSELAMKALSLVLLGESKALGDCPVDLNVQFNITDKIF